MSEPSSESIEVIQRGQKADLKDGSLLVYEGDPTHWSFAYQGLTMAVRPSRTDFKYTVNGESQEIPKGSAVAEWNFIPHATGRIPAHVQGKNTQVIREFITGLESFLNIPNLDVGAEMPKYILNTTNPQMARFLERFGFKTVKTEDNKGFPYDDELTENRVQVVGRISDIQENMRSLKSNRSELLSKLSKRVVKQ